MGVGMASDMLKKANSTKWSYKYYHDRLVHVCGSRSRSSPSRNRWMTAKQHNTAVKTRRYVVEFAHQFQAPYLAPAAVAARVYRVKLYPTNARL